MAMASSCAAMAATTTVMFSSPSSHSARCSGDSSTPSTSGGFSGNSVKFPLATALRQHKAEASENVQASSSSSAQRPAILDPALQYANLMWFKGSYNAQIFVSEDEPADSVVRRFRKAVMQAGVIPECRRRRFFETPQDIAKRKLQASQRRNKTRRFTPRPDNFGSEKVMTGKSGAAKADEDDDYWGHTE